MAAHRLTKIRISHWSVTLLLFVAREPQHGNVRLLLELDDILGRYIFCLVRVKKLAHFLARLPFVLRF